MKNKKSKEETEFEKEWELVEIKEKITTLYVGPNEDIFKLVEIEYEEVDLIDYVTLFDIDFENIIVNYKFPITHEYMHTQLEKLVKNYKKHFIKMVIFFSNEEYVAGFEGSITKIKDKDKKKKGK